MYLVREDEMRSGGGAGQVGTDCSGVSGIVSTSMVLIGAVRAEPGRCFVSYGWDSTACLFRGPFASFLFVGSEAVVSAELVGGVGRKLGPWTTALPFCFALSILSV